MITHAEISRPKAKGDITLKADVSFGDAPPLRVKLRKAEPGADTFNNVPRYDLAAYELQKLFLDPPEYVVPPTALRMMPLADFAKYSPDVAADVPVRRTRCWPCVQYWLSDIKVVADVYDPARFASDPVYARHIGQLNVLTYLIEHRDSNVGNFLIGKRRTRRARLLDRSRRGLRLDRQRPRRGCGRTCASTDCRPIRSRACARSRLPAARARLGVLAQWQLQDGRYVPGRHSGPTCRPVAACGARAGPADGADRDARSRP